MKDVSGVEKFLLGTQFYLRARSGTQKNGAQNKISPPIKAQLEILLYALNYLNST